MNFVNVKMHLKLVFMNLLLFVNYLRNGAFIAKFIVQASQLSLLELLQL